MEKSKQELIIIRQYIDKENCLIDLSKNELEEKAIELLFNMYRFARLYKFDLDYHPDNYCYKDGKLYYLLNEIGLTVRPIRKISGIYWQKQKAYTKKFETTKPVITRKLLDIVYKKSIRDFVYAVYDVSGIFSEIQLNQIFK